MPSGWTRGWTGWVAAHSVLVFLIVGLISAGAVAALVDFRTHSLRLEIDPSVSSLLPESDPERQFYERSRSLFGADDVIVLALSGDDMLSPAALQRIEQLDAALLKIEQVQQVVSLASVPNLRASDGFLDTGAFTSTPATTAAERAALRADIAANPLVRRQLIDEDGRVAAFIIKLRDIDDGWFLRSGMTAALRALAAEHAGGAEVWVTGAPVVKAALTRAVADQMRFTIPAIFAVVAVILLIAFQNLRSVIMPLVTIVIGLLWTFGAIAALGLKVNLVSSIVPPVIITLGLAYTMHLMAEYYAQRKREASGRELIEQMLDRIGLPLVLTGITTAAGFVALALNPLAAVREFAFLSALGVGITVALTLTFLPALLLHLECATDRDPPGAAAFRRAAMLLSGFAMENRRAVIWAGGGVMVCGLLAAFNITVSTDYVRGFSAQHPVRVDYERINEKLGGANPFSIVIDGYVDDTFVEPDILLEIQALQAWLEQQPEIGASISIVDHLRLIYRSFNDGDADFYRVPDTRRITKQLLVFGGSEGLDSLVDKRFATAQIQVRALIEDSAGINALIRRIEPQLAKLPARLDARVTGSTVLVTRTVDDIASGQLLSIGAACLVVYIMLSALFTSWRVGLMALWPNILPVAVYFGTLGLLGIPLNPTTSLIACIVLGVAVDDTIHFLVRFNSEARALGDEKAAATEALRSVLRPVTFTTIALCSGFMVLCFSELQNQVQFGALAAFTLLVAWVTDVTFTPALGSGVRIVTLWDVLRLDLGAEPEKSIPLLKGLSPRQARTFALLSRLQSFESDTRVITEGAEARDIYVIVDGDLQAWVERDGERRELSRMGRGAVMGEVGYFGQKRTANVDTLNDARVLRFNADDLERMRVRYPRIAATIYRNLNLIQAERIANTTRMVT